MYIIAGLSPEVAQRTGNSLQRIKDLPRAIYCLPGFSRSDDALYVSEDYLRIIRDVASLIMLSLAKTKKDSVPIITPSRVFLLFISSTDGANLYLLKNFEFFAYPVMMPTPDEQTVKWRHNPDLVLEAVVSCIRNIMEFTPDINFVINEISQRLRKTPLALPATNFHETNDTPLRIYFRELALAGTWSDIEERLHVRRYTKDDLPDARGIGPRGVSAFTDARGLIFVPPPPELWHAVLRELRTFNNLTVLHNKMNEMYRLGIPVIEGFHYDAQLRGGRQFTNVQLTCCESGEKDSKGWVYANIYPNDFVREG
jgi:hypothetical protein